MDKKKPSKEEKVGSDGLTKKERRALKVQAKQTDDYKAELKNIQQNKATASEVRVDTNKDGAGEKPSIASHNNDTLSEKQKRKLEWEKKQAELGKSIEKKNSTEGLSKAELKAKRREVQEAQRMAKMKAENEKNKDCAKLKENENAENKTKVNQSSPKSKSSETENKTGNRTSNLFGHLLTSNSFKPLEEVYPVNVPNVHPAFIKFGILHATGAIPGANQKTVEFLSAIESLVRDLVIPPGAEFSRCIETALDQCVDFLAERKHVTFAMFNALKSFKTNLMQLDKGIPDEEKKEELLEFVETFIQDQIVKAGISISGKLQSKLFNDDVILVYGWSHLIFNILVDTYKQHNKKISVVIVDSRPSFGGQEMLEQVAAVGIKHKYVMIHSLSHVMPTVTKVLLEADALMTNGYLVSKAGTALIARLAQFCGKPVLVCCETYKFTDKEQTDGMMCNEIGNPDELLDNTNDKSPLEKEEKSEATLFNLLRNLTPSDLVTAVFTELAILPCWSVPAACKAAKLLNMYPIR